MNTLRPPYMKVGVVLVNSTRLPVMSGRCLGGRLSADNRLTSGRLAADKAAALAGDLPIHCGHYAVAIIFSSIVCPFSDEKFNIYNEHHLVVPLCHVEHILPSICLEVCVKCEQFT